LVQRIKVFLSSTIWQQGGPSFISGRQHYSYGIARRKFEMALRCLDVELHDVPRPEIYAAPVSRAFLDNASCHLIFKPTEWIRLLKGVWNIAWVIWEFDKLTGRQTSGPHHPFTDIRRMLTIPQEIWTPCEFTRRVFRAAGIPNVHCIPAPIVVSRMAEPFRFPEIPPDLDKVPWINLRIGFGRYGDINRSFPSHRHRLSEIILEFSDGNQPLVFVPILNPHEPAKNLTALIGGFLEFHNEHPRSLLLLNWSSTYDRSPRRRADRQPAVAYLGLRADRQQCRLADDRPARGAGIGPYLPFFRRLSVQLTGRRSKPAAAGSDGLGSGADHHPTHRDARLHLRRQCRNHQLATASGRSAGHGKWAPTRTRAVMFARAPMSRAHCGTLPGSARLKGGSWAHGRAPRSPASSPSPRLLG
jgi:hypothetical protein